MGFHRLIRAASLATVVVSAVASGFAVPAHAANAANPAPAPAAAASSSRTGMLAWGRNASLQLGDPNVTSFERPSAGPLSRR